LVSERLRRRGDAKTTSSCPLLPWRRDSGWRRFGDCTICGLSKNPGTSLPHRPSCPWAETAPVAVMRCSPHVSLSPTQAPHRRRLRRHQHDALVQNSVGEEEDGGHAWPTKRAAQFLAARRAQSASLDFGCLGKARRTELKMSRVLRVCVHVRRGGSDRKKHTRGRGCDAKGQVCVCARARVCLVGKEPRFPPASRLIEYSRARRCDRVVGSQHQRRQLKCGVADRKHT
jgi:hypothetical protein